MTTEQFRALPEPQRLALRDVFLRHGDALDHDGFTKFINSATFEIGGYGAVMVPWAGMWLGIELDGHTHS